MNVEDKQLYNQLLEKYRSNHLSEEEFQRFISLINKHGLEGKETLDSLAKKDWGPSKGLLKQIEKEEKRLKRRAMKRIWVWSSAAAIALLCVTWVFWPKQVSENIVYKTGYGETQNIELPDGSMVLLNANSRLTWESNWKNTMERQTTLDGEAFFDVAKVENMPLSLIHI